MCSSCAATECFVKVNSYPFLFQVDLEGEIDTKESSGVVDKNGVHFHLVKVVLEPWSDFRQTYSSVDIWRQAMLCSLWIFLRLLLQTEPKLWNRLAAMGDKKEIIARRQQSMDGIRERSHQVFQLSSTLHRILRSAQIVPNPNNFWFTFLKDQIYECQCNWVIITEVVGASRRSRNMVKRNP